MPIELTKNNAPPPELDKLEIYVQLLTALTGVDTSREPIPEWEIGGEQSAGSDAGESTVDHRDPDAS